MDLEVGGGGGDEGEFVGGGVEMEPGAEVGMGNLEFVKGILEKRKVRWF